MTTAPAAPQQVLTMQGIQVPKSAVNLPAFVAYTRRQNLLQRAIATTAGLGSTDDIPMIQTGIISALRIKIAGTLNVVPGTGTVATTFKWPYGFIRACRFTANGQSNLINCSGTALKLIEFADRNPSSDRGVNQSVAGATVNQGTLSRSSESWGVGMGATGVAAGNYDVELVYEVPVAYDQIRTLQGAVFAQTASANLQLSLDYANLADLFTLTGNAAVTFTPSATIEATVYTIPSVNGGIVLPDLSTFHQLVQSPAPNAISQGYNEVTLAGQGVGRRLMRLAFRTFSNGAPLALTAGNYGPLKWLYGGNTVPETFNDGRMLRAWNEQVYNTDVGAIHGYGVFDFSSLYANRDSVDEGSATQLRFGVTLQNAPTNPSLEYVQQTLTVGTVAA